MIDGAPRWAGGWALSRPLFALVALTAQLDRAGQLSDALASPELSFATGPTRLVEAPLLGAPAAWALWGAGLLGPLALLWGGRLARPGLLAFALCHFGLLLSMGLSFRAPERLLLWLCLLLPFGPIDERGLMHKARSPYPRLALMLLFASLYGSTGLKKALQPGWWSGEILALDLLDRWHAGGPLALWLSGQAGLVQAASVFTILVELGWPLLIWGRRTNPWALAGGVALHLGIALVMDVGMLGWLALSMYPVLLEPGVGRRWRR